MLFKLTFKLLNIGWVVENTGMCARRILAPDILNQYSAALCIHLFPIHFFLAACSLRKGYKASRVFYLRIKNVYLVTQRVKEEPIICLKTTSMEWHTLLKNIGLHYSLMPRGVCVWDTTIDLARWNIWQRLIKMFQLGTSHALSEPFLECWKFLAIPYSVVVLTLWPDSLALWKIYLCIKWVAHIQKWRTCADPELTCLEVCIGVTLDKLFSWGIEPYWEQKAR